MKKVTCLWLAVFLLLTACGQGASFSENASSVEGLSWQEQYDLGIHYLSEGNYEEAKLDKSFLAFVYIAAIMIWSL